MLPMVSVVIPVYNAESFISEMLDDLISQTYKEWEVILVDDGSSDNSTKICESYVSKDNRFSLYKRPKEIPKGGNSCRNYGMELARGKYIIWLDADDRIATYCLEQRVSFMEKNDLVDIAVFPAINLRDKHLNIVKFALGFDIPANPIRFFIQGCIWFAVWTNIYRLKSLSDHNIRWSEGLASRQDCDFNLTCMNKNLRFENGKGLPDYFYRVATNQNSISKGINKGKSRATVDFFDLQYNKFKDLKGVPMKSLVHYVYECVILQNSNDVINEFFNAEYFRKNVIDHCKFRLLMKMGTKLPTRMRSIFKLSLFPYSYLKYRNVKINTNRVITEWISYASDLKIEWAKKNESIIA